MAVRWLFQIHRYAGIVLGLLMLMWCLTGIVMMYVPYPALSETAREAGLAPISWRHCCVMPAYQPGAAAASFDIEMMGNTPVMHISPSDAPSHRFLINLETGAPIRTITQTQLRAIALAYARGHAIVPSDLRITQILRDQWTVADGFARDLPLYRIVLGDHAGTEIYISGADGTVVQTTTASQRFWNYFGAVPHWLYFTQLRKEPRLWTEIMIWASLAGCFLAATGLYIGISQFCLAKRMNRWSPYQGISVWHHLPGLVFGIFLLSWIASGLISMNPWGFLEGAGPGTELDRLLGPSIPADQIGATLQALSMRLARSRIVSINSTPLNGHLYLVAHEADDKRMRLNRNGDEAPLTKADLAFISSALAGPNPHTEPRLLADGDNYYFSHDDQTVELPVYRLRLTKTGMLYYFDAVSGALRGKLDTTAKTYRWLQQGLHRMDFTSLLRARPIWDIVMLVLMLGVTTLATTGTYLAGRYFVRAARGRASVSNHVNR